MPDDVQVSANRPDEKSCDNWSQKCIEVCILKIETVVYQVHHAHHTYNGENPVIESSPFCSILVNVRVSPRIL